MSLPRDGQLGSGPFKSACQRAADQGAYPNPVGCAKVFLDRGPCRADEAEIRLLLETSREAVCADPLQLIALSTGGMVFNAVPIFLPPRPRVLAASIALESWPFHPLLAAPECPIHLDKVGGGPARTGRWCRWQRRCWRRDSRRRRRELNALYSLWLIGEWAV